MVSAGPANSPPAGAAQQVLRGLPPPRLPDAELVELAGAGHVPFSEEPGQFLAAVRAYLERIGDGALVSSAPSLAAC